MSKTILHWSWAILWLIGNIVWILATVHIKEAASRFAANLEYLFPSADLESLASPFVDYIALTVGLAIAVGVPIYWILGRHIKKWFIRPYFSNHASGDSKDKLDDTYKDVASFKVEFDKGPRGSSEYQSLCRITVRNTDPVELNYCVARIEQISITKPAGLKLPLPLIPAGHKRQDKGVFKLGRDERATIPVIFRRTKRPKDWCFVDLQGNRYHTLARDFDIVVAIDGGRVPQKFLIHMSIGDRWEPDASIKGVPKRYRL